MKKPSKSNKQLWTGRFQESVSDAVIDYTGSLDVDRRLAFQDLEGTRAHVQMLSSQGILSESNCESILHALSQVETEIKENQFPYRSELEDIHMNIESRLIELVGPSGAGVHSARSRNDQVSLDINLYCRKITNCWKNQLLNLQNSFLDRSGDLKEELFPAWTHLQVAQPISWSHYLLSFCVMFSRDIERLESYQIRTSTSPLGAGAVAGSTLPINPEITAQTLGFNQSFENSYDVVGNRDFILELLLITSQLMIHISRLAEDFIYMSSSGVGWIRLPESLCTGSSMMPQKQNPDVLELARGRAAAVLGHTQAVSTLLKGLPTSYHRDLQEDKTHLFATADIVSSTLQILPLIILGFEICHDKYAHLFKESFLEATDLAEYLVEQDVPFREAHRQVGKLVSYCVSKNKALQELTDEEIQKWNPKCTKAILKNLDPKSSLKKRNHRGGTGVESVEKQLEHWNNWIKERLKTVSIK